MINEIVGEKQIWYSELGKTKDSLCKPGKEIQIFPLESPVPKPSKGHSTTWKSARPWKLGFCGGFKA